MKPKSFSASSLQVAEKCLKRYEVESVARFRTPGGDAAKLGTACHYALEMYVRRTIMGGFDAERTLDTVIGYYNDGFDTEFGYKDANIDAYEDGKTMVTEWWERMESKAPGDRDFDSIKVISTEAKKSFSVTTSIGQIPFNFIMDRVDERPGLGFTCVDYKSVRRPLSPSEMREKLQFRAYAMVMEMEHPGQERYWVEADNLRDPHPTAVAFTPADNRDTWAYICELAERIIATDDPQPTLNNECGYCPIKETCKEVRKSIDVGSVDSVDLDELVNLAAELENQAKAAKAAHEKVRGQLAARLGDLDAENYDNDDYSVKMFYKKTRTIEDPTEVRRIVGEALFSKYGKTADMTLAQFDKLMADPELDPAAKEVLQDAVVKRPSKSPSFIIKKIRKA